MFLLSAGPRDAVRCAEPSSPGMRAEGTARVVAVQPLSRRFLRPRRRQSNFYELVLLVVVAVLADAFRAKQLIAGLARVHFLGFVARRARVVVRADAIKMVLVRRQFAEEASQGLDQRHALVRARDVARTKLFLGLASLAPTSISIVVRSPFGPVVVKKLAKGRGRDAITMRAREHDDLALVSWASGSKTLGIPSKTLQAQVASVCASLQKQSRAYG